MILVRSFQDKDGTFAGLVELRALRADPRARAVDVEHADVRVARDVDRRAAGVRLRLRDPAQLHSAQGTLALDRAAADPRAVAARRALVHLSVRQPGAVQGAAAVAGPEGDLRTGRHGAGDGVFGVPARGDDPARGVVALRRAPLRGGRRDGGDAPAQVPHHHAARCEVRPDLGGDGRVHDGGVRVRRAQGDRRQLSGARDRHLQAGDRTAELPDGRGGEPRAARARRAGLRHRLRRAASPEGARRRAQRARTRRVRRAGATRCSLLSCSWSRRTCCS